MIAMPTGLTFTALAAAVAFLAGAAAGYGWEHRARKAEVAQIRADIAAREAAAAEESRRRLEAAQRAADAALAEKDRRLIALDQTTRRLRNDLKTATTGRPCLSHDARRLLHDAPAFRLGLSAPAGLTLAARPAPAADPFLPSPASGRGAVGEGDSTDADLAGWILDAASLYEQCRARIDALRQWDEVTHGR